MTKSSCGHTTSSAPDVEGEVTIAVHTIRFCTRNGSSHDDDQVTNCPQIQHVCGGTNQINAIEEQQLVTLLEELT